VIGTGASAIGAFGDLVLTSSTWIGFPNHPIRTQLSPTSRLSAESWLGQEGAASLAGSEMDRRVTNLEARN
jgi:hypothetical protein